MPTPREGVQPPSAGTGAAAVYTAPVRHTAVDGDTRHGWAASPPTRPKICCCCPPAWTVSTVQPHYECRPRCRMNPNGRGTQSSTPPRTLPAPPVGGIHKREPHRLCQEVHVFRACEKAIRCSGDRPTAMGTQQPAWMSHSRHHGRHPRRCLAGSSTRTPPTGQMENAGREGPAATSLEKRPTRPRAKRKRGLATRVLLQQRTRRQLHQAIRSARPTARRLHGSPSCRASKVGYTWPP